MKLHIFNPEHDIALAANMSNFTAPHAGSQLRHDLGWLPALWAEEGDAVLVDDVDFASSACLRFQKNTRLRFPAVKWVEKRQLSRLPIDAIEPWGWDLALRATLQRGGCPQSLLPSDEQLDHVRRLSSRLLARELLSQLRMEGTLGEAVVGQDEEGVATLLASYGRLVLKAPWSSSGRGLRFIDAERNTLSMQAGWLRNVTTAQGYVMAEPYYNKVKDFAVEFEAHPDGHISCLGLSLFHTKNGAYTGNVLATEQAKRMQIGKYVDLALLDEVTGLICRHVATLFDGHYVGPFGVDMMVVRKEGSDAPLLLHPCVELNLRRTMGHVALALTRLCNPRHDDELQKVMRMELTDNYLLKLNTL